AEPLIRALETAVERARAAEPARRTRVFCPIWERPWMGVGPDTYADDLLALCGGDNVFRDHRERRYPIVSDAEIAAARPEVILLPDEPYAFGARDVAELGEIGTPAAATGRIHCIDGTLISWYGPRIARAIAEVAALLAEPAPGKEAGS